MDVVHYFFTKQLPKYFLNLPLPKTFAGFTELSTKEWMDLLPFFGFIVLFLMLLISQLFDSKQAPAADKAEEKEAKVNPSIDKEKEKVAHTFDIEDLGKKTVLCRCWRSKKFPYCDGSHKAHNNETGDNVGPVIITCPARDEASK